MRECRVKAIVPPGKSLATDSDSRIWIWCKILQVILIVSAYFLRTRENLILVLSHPFFFKKKKLICLLVPDIVAQMLWHMESLIFVAAYGI